MAGRQALVTAPLNSLFASYEVVSAVCDVSEGFVFQKSPALGHRQSARDSTLMADTVSSTSFGICLSTSAFLSAVQR